MHRYRLVLAIALVTSVATLSAMSRGASSAFPVANASVVAQGAPAGFVMRSNGANFEVQQATATNEAVPPYDAVVLRRTVGGVTLDCGRFARPVITDNGVERRWIYSVARPSKGTCASVAGAQYVAVGQKGTVERSTAAVP